MCATPWNGHQVVLAGRVHRDVLDQHQLVVVLVERGREDLVRVLARARRRSRRRRGPPGPGCPAARAGRGPPPPRAGARGRRRPRAPGRPDRRPGRDRVGRARRAPRSSLGRALRRRPTGVRSPARCPLTVPPFWAACSAGVSTGGWSDGVRLPKPLYGAREGRLTTGAQMRAMSSLDSVSFSISSSTSWSRTCRYSTRISQASSCAASISARISASMSAATASE